MEHDDSIIVVSAICVKKWELILIFCSGEL